MHDKKRFVIIIGTVFLMAFVAACFALGRAAEPQTHQNAVSPFEPPPLANGAEWRLSREGKGDGAATRKIYGGI